jgi:hypothetical protein
VAHFVAALLSFLKGVTEDDVAAIRRDDARIRQFFARFTKPEKVGPCSRRVLDLVVMAPMHLVQQRRGVGT